ncbi:oxidation resistance protein 1-like isoform X1 [Acomys russatus]|uniref:oxidation resistance protein 1-like isoform X1 n=1 Tax=Acomys russatus TaxID=60746 RepID=UPI0021E207C4|nr:oxidation resistance protein 1-like isoform X1 [Acomys russatus]
MSVSNLSWLKKKSQSVDITAPGFNPLGAGKQAPQASKPPAPKTPIIEEEQNNSANTQKHPSRKSELKRFYTIGHRNGRGNYFMAEVICHPWKPEIPERTQTFHKFQRVYICKSTQVKFLSWWNLAIYM